MPAPIPSLTVLEVQINGVVSAAGVNSKKSLLTLHYRRTAVVTAPTKAAFDTVFQANIVVPLAAALNNRWLQKFNTLRFLNDPTDTALPFAHAAVGAVAGDSMPTYASAYILFRTALRGKSYKGNIKPFPLSEADTTAGTADIFNAASIALWTTLITALGTPLTDATGNTWNLCVYSRKLSKPSLFPVATIVTNDVSTILLNKTVRKNKRRQQLSDY